MNTPDERPRALRSAEAAATAWAETVEHQQQATPRHADFYALAGEMVATLYALDDLTVVLAGQVGGYGAGPRALRRHPHRRSRRPPRRGRGNACAACVRPGGHDGRGERASGRRSATSASRSRHDRPHRAVRAAGRRRRGRRGAVVLRAARPRAAVRVRRRAGVAAAGRRRRRGRGRVAGLARRPSPRAGPPLRPRPGLDPARPVGRRQRARPRPGRLPAGARVVGRGGRLRHRPGRARRRRPPRGAGRPSPPRSTTSTAEPTGPPSCIDEHGLSRRWDDASPASRTSTGRPS